MAESGTPAFVRKASGLVREFSSASFLFYGIAVSGLFYGFFFIASVAPLIGGNVIIGMLLYLVAMIAVTVTYYVTVVIMPRSGGDYVFVSRALHPSIGFIGNLTLAMLLIMLIGTTCVSIQAFGFGILFGYLGVVLNNPSWYQLATTMSSPTWILGLSWIWIVLGGLVALGSVKFYVKIQNVIFIIMIVGYVAMLAALAATSPANYAISFNNFVAQYKGAPGNYYNGVVTAAQGDGFVIPVQTAFSYASYLLFPLFAACGLMQWNAQLGGEIRNPKKTALLGLVGGGVIYVGLLAAGMLLLYHAVGFDFLSSLNYLLYNDYAKIPLPAYPYANMLTAIATTPALGAFILVMAILQQFLYIPGVYLYVSRGLFAYSFDGLLPQWFAKVSPRTHGPVNAVLTSIVAALIFFVIVNIPQTASYIYLVGSIYTWISSLIPTFMVGLSIVAIVKYKPNLLGLSPIKGIRLVALGVLTMFMMLAIVYAMLTDSVYGANSPFSIALGIGIVVVIALVYIAAKIRGGPLLSLAFKEVPPA